MRLKDTDKIDRPREKAERYGYAKLNDVELLAIFLGSGIKGRNVLELSRKILKLLNAKGGEPLSLEKLTSIKGLGKIKAGQVIAALEFGKRIHSKTPETVLAPRTVFELCSDIRNSKREQFAVFYLSARNTLIAREVVSVGTLDSSLAHPREIFEPALRYGAASIILVHNHPSGDTTPSVEDKAVTERIMEASKIMGFGLLDHIIVTNSDFLSFKERKVLF